MQRRAFLKASASGLALSAGAASVWAEPGYPSKMITMVVPYPAGGPSDFIARKLQPDFSKLIGQQVIVENIAGAGGALACQKVLSSAPDGHTVMLASPMELILAPLGMTAVKHKPEDFKLVSLVLNASMVLITKKDLAANSVDELVALSKKSAAPLTYGSVGHGSLYHLVAERFVQKTGAKLTHVPYKGAAPLMQDLMGGQIDLVFIPLAGSTGQLITDGRIKALGIAAKTPNPNFPQIPAMASAKGMEDFEFDLWIGMQVSKGTPDSIVAKLNQTVAETLKNEELRKAFFATGNTIPAPMSQADTAKTYTREIERYQAIAKSINLQPQ